MAEPTTPDKHFLPDYHDCPDIGEEIFGRIKVPVKKLPKKSFFKEAPWEVLVTDWYWLDAWGPLTKEQFDADLLGAMDHFAGMVNELDEFRTFPISYFPATRYGVAYHDWTGQSYPFDLRFLIVYKQDIQIETEEGPTFTSGLKFFLMSLVEKREEVDPC